MRQSSHCATPRAYLFLTAWLLASHTWAEEAASPCSFAVRPCDSMWLVSTRAFPCGDPRLHASDLSYQQRSEQGSWQRSELRSLLESDNPGAVTVIWIHGNRSTSGDALSEGWATYRALVRCTTCRTPVRFIIYSWPSERIEGSQLDDVRVKAARTNPNAYYLAWLIDQFDGDVPVSLIGYSYGARVSTGALHLLGGGAVNGWTLSNRAHPTRRPVRVVLAAAALDNHWLIPGHRHGNAISQVEKLTVLYNSCDRVLKRYDRLYCHRNDAQALGFTGVAGLGRLNRDRATIVQFDACCYVSKYHSWDGYLASGTLMARIRNGSLPAVVATELAAD